MLSGNATGYNVDPMLNAPGSGGTLGNADNLVTLSAYQFKSTSPLIALDRGLNLAQFYSNFGSVDFYGDPVKDSNGLFNIGAD
jgi:hypothetical protein